MQWISFAATAASLLSVLVAFEASASNDGASRSSDEIVTYEVQPRYIVTREISDEVVIKEIAPQATRRKRTPKAAPFRPIVSPEGISPDIPDLGTFLDRLMLAESGGRDTAANPRSTALGPFQFIKSTFLDVARRHFPMQTSELSDEQVLALRTARHFAKSAAQAYTLENAAYLKSLGQEASWGNLRLAYLLGPSGACRILQAPPDTPLTQLLGASVLQANPFMASMTASGLIARAARDVQERAPAQSRARPAAPQVHGHKASAAPTAQQ